MIQIGMLTLIFLNEIQKLQNIRKLTYSMLNDIECYMYQYEMIITCIS